MIILLKRADLLAQYARLEFERIVLFHFGLDEETARRAELIVFIEDGKVCVLRGTKWPYGKEMSGADLLKYIANHGANITVQR